MVRAVTVSGVVALVALLIVAYRRDDRAAVFGWMWAIAAFLPVCPLPWAERYAYLPAVGLALVAAAALNRIGDRRTATVTAVIVVALVVFALGSVFSAYQWRLRNPPDQNRSTAAAQWNPAPKAVSSTRSPGLIRPF